MNQQKRLVVDANILLRAVFGVRVFSLLELYEDQVLFSTPDACFQEALRHIPPIAAQKSLDSDEGTEILHQVSQFVQPVDKSFYEDFEGAARARIERRDPNDWPIVATALLLNAPIWTEDYDFFGCGIATWTSDRVEIYLRNPSEP
jgi:predicted nucleic acid-binding protein